MKVAFSPVFAMPDSLSILNASTRFWLAVVKAFCVPSYMGVICPRKLRNMTAKTTATIISVMYGSTVSNMLFFLYFIMLSLTSRL